MSEPTGIERLRAAVAAFNNCNETFLDPFTPEQLLRLHDAWKRATHDFYPDQWSARQVREAIGPRCIAPTWRAFAGATAPDYSEPAKRAR